MSDKFVATVKFMTNVTNTFNTFLYSLYGKGTISPSFLISSQI